MMKIKKLNRDLGTQSDPKQFTIVNIDAHSITTVLYDHPHRYGARSTAAAAHTLYDKYLHAIILKP